MKNLIKKLVKHSWYLTGVFFYLTSPFMLMASNSRGDNSIIQKLMIVTYSIFVVSSLIIGLSNYEAILKSLKSEDKVTDKEEEMVEVLTSDIEIINTTKERE